MPGLRIVTDSDCDLPLQILEKYRISIFPMSVAFGSQKFWDNGKDLSTEDFYNRLRGPLHPSTDHPDPDFMRRTYLDLARDGSKILSIHVSNRLSQTVAIARRLAEDLRGQADIEVLDTLAASLAQGLLVMRAAILAEAGVEREQIVSVIKSLIPQTSSVLSINSLDYLARGGRLNRAQALIGSVAGLKPIIGLTEAGELSLVARAYGWERAVVHIQRWVAERITYARENWMGVIHSRLPEEAKSLAAHLRDQYGPRDLIVAEIGPSIGTHIGPGALGVAFFSEKGRG